MDISEHRLYFVTSKEIDHIAHHREPGFQPPQRICTVVSELGNYLPNSLLGSAGMNVPTGYVECWMIALRKKREGGVG